MRSFLSTALRALLALLVYLLAVASADAAGWRRQAATSPACANGRCPTAYAPARAVHSPPAAGFRSVPVVSPRAAQAPSIGTAYYAAVTPQVAGPAYGDILTAVNGYRASHGLRALVYEATLSQWAASNSSACTYRGQDHHVMAPGAGQCVAPTADVGHAARMWEFSPAHFAIMNSPTATYAGIATVGAYTTLNVR